MASELARQLRAAREARGLSLDEAARHVRIRRRYLEAIEAGRFNELPEGPPARGFVRNYARFLGLDPESAISSFEAEVGVPVLLLKDPPPPPPERHKQVSRYTQLVLPEVRWRGPLPDPVQTELDAMAESELDQATGSRALLPARQPRLRAARSSLRLRATANPTLEQYDPNRLTSRSKPRWYEQRNRAADTVRVLGLLAAFVLLVFGVILLAPRAIEWISRVELPRIGQPQPELPRVRVTIFAPTTPPAPAAPLPRGSEGILLALDVREPARIRLWIDGSLVFDGTAPLGLGLPYRAKRSIELETDNAGAFDVILNGQRLGPLGAPNEVVRRRWEAEQQP
ncbi:MAG: helix-turn-helix domain-containing protein [Anaerolineae bacterium]|nr:helix-turn-helix domain-containing protein [Thermoflexales bacterium]MDW8394972.1 helix-turn-helix domain-containing protein [Anaerolineae bacterium]